MHLRKLSTTSYNVCECNAPPQWVTPPQYVISPICTNCHNNLASPLTHSTPPFCHDIGKGVVPNKVTHSKERKKHTRYLHIHVSHLCYSNNWRETRRVIFIKCVNQTCFAYKTCSIQVQNTMVFGKANWQRFLIRIQPNFTNVMREAKI